jgi:Uma2 family endonuclease
VGDPAVISVQDPAIVAERSVPQPDLALLRPRRPTAADVLLVIEVPDTTLAFDLGMKLRLYALCGIPEVWIVDLGERVARVFREPGTDEYRVSLVAEAEERIVSVVPREAWIDVRQLFAA